MEERTRDERPVRVRVLAPRVHEEALRLFIREQPGLTLGRVWQKPG